MDNETKIDADAAFRIIEKDYNADVRSIAEEAIAMIRKGEIEDRDALDTWCHESIDGNERIIYTHKARIVMICTDNPDAYEEELGDDVKPTVEQQAYMAMLADLREWLDTVAEDFDIDDEAAWPTPENVKAKTEDAQLAEGGATT